MTTHEYISTGEMAELARVTYRMLDMWVRQGYVAPIEDASGSGNPRRWAPWQLGEVVEERERMGRVHYPKRGLVTDDRVPNQDDGRRTHD